MPNLATLGLSFIRINDYRTEVHAMERQSEEMRRGIAGLGEIVNAPA